MPIFNEDTATLNVTGGGKATTITLGDDVKYVNVPYNISIKTKNSTAHEGDLIISDTLYADGYSEIEYNSVDPMQAFISDINYYINDTASIGYNYQITSGDVSNGKKVFTVKAVLTPKSGTPAKVGSAGNATFTKTAIVRCISDSVMHVNGYEINSEKSLVYNDTDNTYDLTVDMDIAKDGLSNFFIYDAIPRLAPNYQTSTFSHLPNADHSNNTRGTNAYMTYQRTIDPYTLEPGYYYIQVWGGDGGDGGYYRTGSSNYTYTSGSPGGTGAYIDAYIYIPEEIVTNTQAGHRGYDGGYFTAANDLNNSNNDKYAAYGGGYTSFTVGESVIVAGGGGGGTPMYCTSNNTNPSLTDKPGEPAKDVEYVDYVADLSECNGATGTVESRTSVTPGTGGRSFVTGDFMEELPDEVKDYIMPYSNPSKPSPTKSGNGAVRITKLGVYGGYGYNDTPVCIDLTADDVTAKKADINNTIESTLANGIGDFTLNETISKYFDIVGIETNGEPYNKITYPVSNGNSSTEQGVDFNLNNTSLTNATLGASDSYDPIDGYAEYSTTRYDYSYGFSGSGTVTFKLSPKTGFFGGNDVPLLENAKIAYGNDDINIPALDYTDFANVALAGETLEDTVSTEPVFIDYNTTLTADKLSENISAYPPNVTNDLCDDFADYSAVAYDDKVGQNITEDTDCFVTAELKATSAAEKANVIGAVDKVSRNFKVPVYVSYPIETQLTHLTSDAATKFPTAVDDTELVFEITAEKGYDLPAEDDVEITNTDLTDPNAVPTAMENAVVEKIDDKIAVRIPRSSITGKVTVKASGVDSRHNVKYYYEVYDPVGKAISLEEAVDSKKFANGDIIDGITYPALPDKYLNGYDGYFWDWSIETDTNGDHIMGQEDVIIVGTYKPITYAIKVNYYTKESEDDPNPQLRGTYISPLDRTLYDNGTYKIALTKGAEFYIASPDFEGYVTDTPYIAGVVDDAFIDTLNETVDGHPSITVAVYYTKVSDDTELVVNFVECDVRGAPLGIASDKHIIGDNNYDYSGIQADIDSRITSANEVVKITKVEEDASETKVTAITAAGTYNVYYREKPQTVTIRLFKNSGDTEPVATRTAVIGREYSYDPDNDDYIPLPTVVDSTHEYRHTGWKTESGDIIEDDTIVSGSAGDVIKLCAVWESTDITITVRYLFAMNVSDVEKRGTAAAAQIAKTMTYGKSYTLNAAEIPNYTAEPQQITGVALADKAETFYYIDAENPNKSITIKANIYSIYYQDSDSGKAADGAPLLKGGTFALYAQDGTLIGTKQNTSGVVSWNNTEFDIRQDMTYTIKCTAPPIGYGAGEAVVTVGTSDTDIVIDDIEIFLDVTPFELPFAGSTPMTGYTVFGLSTMVLAVFLLFVHMRSKTEEEKIKERIRRV